MSSSSRFFILSLGLLIAVSGCSGSRMRKAFRADREFLTLSELEEYDGRRDAADEQPKRWSEKLASFSKRSSDEKDEATSKRQGFLNIGRLLGRDDDSIPPDPFVVADEDSAGDESAAEDSDDRVIVSVGSSREVPGDEAEPLVSDDWVTEMAASAAAEDRRSSGDDSSGISFADILAEFEDETEESEDLDSLADQIMAEHASRSKSLDDVVADSSVDAIDADNVDQFELSPDMFLDEATEAQEDVPVLSLSDDAGNPFDVEQDTAESDAEVPTLPATFDESPDDDFGEPAVEIAGANARENQLSRVTELPSSQQGMTDIFGDDLLDNGSLWNNSGRSTGWESDSAAEQTVSRPGPQRQQQEKPAWDSARSSHASTSFDRPERRQRTEDSMSFASNPSVLTASEPGLQTPVNTLAQLPANPPASKDAANDRFLHDFETQVEATPVSASVTTEPANAPIAGFSPKMWVVLVGSVIILCLLLAPERQNVSEVSNR